jgi:hypothetical protein
MKSRERDIEPNLKLHDPPEEIEESRDQGQTAARSEEEIVARKKTPHVHPLKQIRRFCLTCVSDQRKEIRFCLDTDCPLWFLRFGKSPKRVINEERPLAWELFDPENFKEGAKFSSEKTIDSF